MHQQYMKIHEDSECAGGGLLVMRLEATDSGTDKVVKAQLEVMFSIPVTKGQPTFSLVRSKCFSSSCQALTSSIGLVVVGIFWRVWK